MRYYHEYERADALYSWCDLRTRDDHCFNHLVYLQHCVNYLNYYCTVLSRPEGLSPSLEAFYKGCIFRHKENIYDYYAEQPDGYTAFLALLDQS